MELREVPRHELQQVLTDLSRAGYHPLTVLALDERPADHDFTLRYILLQPNDHILAGLRVPVPTNDPWFPSATDIFPSVHWDEREIADLFGLHPQGHPDPRRLVLPDDWPVGVYPLRKDASVHAVPAAEGLAWPPHLASGHGVVDVPVGPVHAGIIESGHFRFSTMGETILHLDLRLFWKHRGLEKLLEGKGWDEGILPVERTCAACSASHQAAYSQAVEQILAWEIPPRGAALRATILELERLYNHVNDLGAICAGTGFAVASNVGANLKERFLRLNLAIWGHRYLFGTIRPGGTQRDLDDAAVGPLLRDLAALHREWEHFRNRLLRHAGFIDRLVGTGIVSLAIARDLGAVGPVARASGITGDLRSDLPYGAYGQLSCRPVVKQSGDVMARVMVRIGEVSESFRLLEGLLTSLPHGLYRTPPPADAAASGEAIGWVESPRGADVHWLSLEKGRITRCRIRSASFANWPLIMEAVKENVIGDFPLINKSFELCYACADR